MCIVRLYAEAVLGILCYFCLKVYLFNYASCKRIKQLNVFVLSFLK